jgi:hypothetical protein
MELLMHCVRHRLFRAERYIWVDAGICNSFGPIDLTEFDFSKIAYQTDKVFVTTFPYAADKEIHGYSIAGYDKLCGAIPNKVCRATLFGGSGQAISALNVKYDEFLAKSLELGFIGTEESLLTGVAINDPDLFSFYDMPNGDIKNYLETIRREE